jgi:phosphoinositide-3-kinase, regulatory subunit 4
MSRECSSANVEPTYQRTAEREALLDIPNVYSYQTFIDSDKAGYLIRQWVASNLYDRIR